MGNKQCHPDEIPPNSPSQSRCSTPRDRVSFYSKVNDDNCNDDNCVISRNSDSCLTENPNNIRLKILKQSARYSRSLEDIPSMPSDPFRRDGYPHVAISNSTKSNLFKRKSIFQMSAYEKCAQLKKWTAFEQYEVLYDSEINEYSSREINSRICGKDNVMIIVISEDEQVFGCFHQDVIPPTNGDYQKVESTEFILFYLQHNNTKPVVYGRSKQTLNSLNLRSNNDRTYIIDVYSAFTLNCNKKITFHPYLRENYSVNRKDISPFTLAGKPKRADKLVCVRWY
ncbi:TLDc domain-containing protein [Entamoeba marina]